MNFLHLIVTFLYVCDQKTRANLGIYMKFLQKRDMKYNCNYVYLLLVYKRKSNY